MSGPQPTPAPGPPAPPPPPGPTPGPIPSSSKPPLKPLTGFQSALEHTGIPRSVLTWKPRLPSRNWSIFLTISGTLFYLYYDDRKQCRIIKEDTIKKVEYMGKQVLEGGSLADVRKIKVYGARCPEDGDDDRALRYFRKYMKPYLVAAGIDYEYPLTPPIIHGSVARSTHSTILSKRRQALGLEPKPLSMSFPGQMDPSLDAQRELEGGTVLVGRASFKEYMEGLKRGWMGGVNPWSLEDDVKRKIEGDGVFDDPATAQLRDAAAAERDLATANLDDSSLPSTPSPVPSNPTGLGFLSRPTPPPFSPNTPNGSQSAPSIPAHLHLPPSPLPAQPPILLLPYTNHMGFKAFPYFIYQFFTERHRVRAGSEAALALIESKTRPFQSPTREDEGVTTDPETGKLTRQGGDLDFDLEGESFTRKSFKKFPSQIETARKDYYDALRTRVESVLDLQAGRRQMTDAELSGKTKVEMIDEMKDERLKKEMRWYGGEDGYEIVKPEQPVVWDPRWDGWLRVFVKSDDF